MKKVQTKNDSNVATLFLRRMAIIFLCIILVIITGFTVLYVVHDIQPIKSLLYVYIIQHIIWLFGFSYFKDLPIEPLIMMYISYILIALFPIACIYWNSENTVVFLWYLLVLLGIIVFQARNIVLWIIVILAIVVSVFFFSSLFPQVYFTPLLIVRVNILTVIVSIILGSFFAVIYVKKSNINEFILEEAKTLQAATENVANLERDKALYNDIIEYLEKNKAFKNPDFNAHALAKALNSNVKYISKAISAGGGGDFPTLLNKFRINYVKLMFDSGTMKKYTIDYIYTEAGYKYRSTFNTAFKSITNMTPSEYLSQQNANII